MALLSVVGAELDADLTPELSVIVADNPLITEQEERMIRTLQESWENIEVGDETLGLDDLTLDAFRQELYEELTRNKKRYEEMPNGCFSGLLLEGKNDLLHPLRPCLVALMGYPAKGEGAVHHQYEKLHLALADAEGHFQTWETIGILRFLRDHQDLPRHESEGLQKGDDQTLKRYVDWVKRWLEVNRKLYTISFEKEYAAATPDKQKEMKTERPLIAQFFLEKNLDLITWLEINPQPQI
jgi:hypothetical protein